MATGIGEAAAILQLVAAAGGLAHKVGIILQAYAVAGGEVDYLRARVDTTKEFLENYQRALSNKYPACVDPSAEQSLKKALLRVKANLNQLNAFTASLPARPSPRDKTRWIRELKKKAGTLEMRLDRSMRDLSLALVPVDVYAARTYQCLPSIRD